MLVHYGGKFPIIRSDSGTFDPGQSSVVEQLVTVLDIKKKNKNCL